MENLSTRIPFGKIIKAKFIKDLIAGHEANNILWKEA